MQHFMGNSMGNSMGSYDATFMEHSPTFKIEISRKRRKFPPSLDKKEVVTHQVAPQPMSFPDMLQEESAV